MTKMGLFGGGSSPAGCRAGPAYQEHDRVPVGVCISV
jgi:hypothetical protein